MTSKIFGEQPAAPTGTGWRDLEGGGKGYAKDGSWAIGWFELNSAKYYFGTYARMYTGWSDIIVGDKTIRYYFNPVSGDVARGTWMDIDGKKYYFRPSGSMATGFADVDDAYKRYFDGEEYTFSNNGEGRYGHAT